MLIVHGTTGSGASLLRPEFAGELFRKGGVLDATRYYIVLPDALGHGRSSKPSDGLRARFPRYGYLDMVEAQRRLLVEGLGVRHLRLVMGTSMGGMHTWLWGGRHPDFMDALLPLASLPTQISGRNRAWRRTLMDAIRRDPGWKGGDYRCSRRPAHGRGDAVPDVINSVLRQQEAPTMAAADAVFDQSLEPFVARSDANDVLYQVEASFDYDPAPLLGEDQGAARRDQFRGRPDQSAGAGVTRARDSSRAARPRDHHSCGAGDGWPRHAYDRENLAGVLAGVAGGDGGAAVSALVGEVRLHDLEMANSRQATDAAACYRV